MSLRPTERNRVVGIALSAQEWARHAIGSDKRSGPEGFENFKSSGWCHFTHYQHISKEHPERSKPEAADEMAEYRSKLVDEIWHTAKLLDAQIMRLQRMEEQMSEVERQ